MSTATEEKKRIDYHEMITPLTPIIIRRYPGDVESAVGWCTTVDSDNIGGVALLPSGALRPFDGLYHIDDPTWGERPDLAKEDDLGVFELSDGAKLMNALITKQAGQEKLLVDLAADVSQLKAHLGNVKADITRMKKPGKNTETES